MQPQTVHYVYTIEADGRSRGSYQNARKASILSLVCPKPCRRDIPKVVRGYSKKERFHPHGVLPNKCDDSIKIKTYFSVDED